MVQIAVPSALFVSRMAVANATAAKDLFRSLPPISFPPLDTALQVTPGYRDALRCSKITIVYIALDDRVSHTMAKNTQL
jgi:hypothetical protein